MPAEAPAPQPMFPPAFEPLDTTFTAALTFLLSHLILVPIYGPFRLGDEGWASLDACRISHPSQAGWIVYGAYGLAVATLLGALLGASHRITWRTVQSERGRYLLGLAFMLIAAVVCFLSPLFLHRGSPGRRTEPAPPLQDPIPSVPLYSPHSLLGALRASVVGPLPTSGRPRGSGIRPR